MTTSLTPSLEDYLETIYLLQQGDSREARVRDIASARSVKASSVSPALRRLSDLGYLCYEQRETIRLTEPGKIAARRVYARHVLLFQFFHNILGMDEAPAREEACGLEHALSDEGMDRLVRFLESLTQCGENPASCAKECRTKPPCSKCLHCEKKTTDAPLTISDIEDNETVSILRIHASGSDRQRILDMGILPNVSVQRLRATNSGILVNLAHHELELTQDQAKSIAVRRN